jgi:hypothetical protein
MTPTAQIAPAAETAPLSDEAILGIEAESASAARGYDSQGSADAIEAEFASRDTAPGAENRETDERALSDSREEQRAKDSPDDDRRDDDNARDAEERAAKPESESHTKRDANSERTLPITSVAEFDAGYYSGDAASRTALAQSLFSSDPAAFRAMFDEAARLLGATATTRDGGIIDARDAAPHGPTPALVDDATRNDTLGRNGQSEADRSSAVRADRDALTGAANAANSQGTSAAQGSFPAESYRAFENSTNEAVAREVRGAITRTLEQVLPEGVAAGAAKRIGEDIFGEVGKLLAADAQLSSQVGESLRGWRFGVAEQQQVASLLSGRARQILPSVARRVIGEWTNSVLSTARTRATRSEAAARRVDVGAAASGDAAGRGAARALRPREIDYARTSDDDIFAM